RGTWHDARRLVRPGQDVHVHGDRSGSCAPAGDRRLPKGRHRLDSRRVRRMAGQVPPWTRVWQGAHPEDGPDPHAPVSRATAGARRARRDRPIVHHHAPRAPGRSARDVSHVPRQTGLMHQGRDAASGDDMNRKFALVTGASSGIGYELALICAKEGYDLAIAADSPDIYMAATTFQNLG